MVGLQKRKIQRAISLLLVMMYFSSLTAQAQYGGGTGEPNNPYLIYTAEQMNAIGAEPNDWDKHFKLTADIDLSAYTGTAFNIIGNETTPFSGVFDGNGHTISNFSYTSTIKSQIGLFRSIGGPNAEIRDLGLIGPNIDVAISFDIGSLVGLMKDGTITRCYVEGGDVKGYWRVGGLVGLNSNGCMIRCYSTSLVSGHNHVGGLIGSNMNGSVIQCYSTGSITGDRCVGGLAGINFDGSVSHCYSTGAVSGHNDVGGLVGKNRSVVIHCYSTGPASGQMQVGGLVGAMVGEDFYNVAVIQCYSSGAVNGTGTNVGGLVGADTHGSDVFGCFWDIDMSGQATSAGGTGLTSAQMQDIQTYQNARWDFWGHTEDGLHENWRMPDEGGYPVLAIFSGYTPPQLQGLGKSEDPYLISDAEELGAMVYYSPYAHYRLGASIDLSSIGWGTAVVPWFAGKFDGNSLTISNLTIKGESYLGLFGMLVHRTEVKDLGVVDVNIAGSGDDVGGLAAYNSGSISNCDSTGSVSGHLGVGGLVGRNEGDLINCSSTDAVNGRWEVGGLVGHNYDGAVNHCYSNGTASGGDVVGGLVGTNFTGHIANCYASTSVDGNDYVGGLVGDNFGSSEHAFGDISTISNCYATGRVTGIEHVGGLLGFKAGAVFQSFWDVETSGQMTSAGGQGRTTAEMQDINTFLNAGWDFVDETANGTDDIWWILEGQDYPRLWWEPTEP